MKMLLIVLLMFAAQLISAVELQHDNLLLGIPGHADTIVDRQGFALGYMKYHGLSAWVIYKLTREEVLTGTAMRTAEFKSDPDIAGGSAVNADYRKSGYDRGHLAPAADMAFSRQTMDDSFYYSNISPQHPSFNRGIWKKLEEQIRQFAIAEGEIYVVSGPVLPKEKSITIGHGRVTVPTHYYKVVYDLTQPQKMIAFILPNQGSCRSVRDFAVTVDAVEALTGLDFFSLVPQPDRQQMKKSISIQAWEWSR